MIRVVVLDVGAVVFALGRGIHESDIDSLIDQWNTVLKMAKKRALVDAVLAATRSSELFSRTKQELESH